MSGTFMAPMSALYLPSAHHKHYTARSATPHESPAPTSLAHDLFAKHSAAKWLKKQRREYEVNHEIRKAKQEARQAEEVEVSLRERSSSQDSTEEGKMTAAFAG